MAEGQKLGNESVMMEPAQKHFLIQRFVLKEDVGLKNCFEKDYRILGIGQWGNWSECSKTCGNGVKTRRRTCEEDVCSEIDLDSSTCFKIGCEYQSTKIRFKRT